MRATQISEERAAALRVISQTALFPFDFFFLLLLFPSTIHHVVFSSTHQTHPLCSPLHTGLLAHVPERYRIHTFQRKQAHLIQESGAAAQTLADVRGRVRKGCCEGILGQTAGR